MESQVTGSQCLGVDDSVTLQASRDSRTPLGTSSLSVRRHSPGEHGVFGVSSSHGHALHAARIRVRNEV